MSNEELTKHINEMFDLAKSIYENEELVKSWNDFIKVLKNKTNHLDIQDKILVEEWIMNGLWKSYL